MMPRLVLFDIDGTLLRPIGIGRRSLERAFAERYGRTGVFEGIRFHGRTDPEILGDGLARIGAPPAELRAAVATYLVHLEREIAEAPPLALPGVMDLMKALRALPEVVLGLVTGNVRRGAAIKLGRDGLWPHFDVGAFGDDSTDRAELVRLARQRAERLGRGSFAGRAVIHVGDTENDVLAARGGDAVAVAVATGGMDRAALAAHSPDHLFDSFEPVDRFLAEVLA